MLYKLVKQMKNFFNLNVRIPDKYKKDIQENLIKENLFKSLWCCIILFIIETLIYFIFNDQSFYGSLIIIIIIIFSVVSLPILYATYKRPHMGYLGNIVLFVYYLTILLLYCFLSVFTQSTLASINTYIICMFGLTAIIYISPMQNFILYLIVYVIFFLVLPFFQPNPNIIKAFRINAFVMNVFAWIFNCIVYRMRITNYLQVKLIEEKNELLNDMVKRDSMTTLINHESTYHALNEEMQRAIQTSYPLSIVMIDIDNFKYINDRFGHLAGDQAIKRVANLLLENSRKTDIVCRYGGEEFLMILTNTTLNETVLLTHRIKDTIEKTNIENEIQITVSGGICEFQDEKTGEELIKKADTRLYLAKNNGKNRFEMM